MRSDSVNSGSGLKTTFTIVFSDHDSYKRTKIEAIWQHHKRVLSIFLPYMRRNGYLGTSGQKSDPAIPLRQHRFPIRPMHFHYRVTFTGYIPCFCATESHDFVTLPFDLECLMYNAAHVWPHTNFYYPMTIGYWDTYEYWKFDHIITFPLSETVTAHAPCHVTFNQGQK